MVQVRFPQKSMVDRVQGQDLLVELLKEVRFPLVHRFPERPLSPNNDLRLRQQQRAQRTLLGVVLAALEVLVSKQAEALAVVASVLEEGEVLASLWSSPPC